MVILGGRGVGWWDLVGVTEMMLQALNVGTAVDVGVAAAVLDSETAVQLA